MIGRRRRGGRERLAACRFGRRGAAAFQQLLDAADRVAVLIEQFVDAPRQRDIVRPVIAPVARALQRLQLRKARFPVTQDVLRDPEVSGEFADRPESMLALADRFGHAGLTRSGRSARA